MNISGMFNLRPVSRGKHLEMLRFSISIRVKVRGMSLGDSLPLQVEAASISQ